VVKDFIEKLSDDAAPRRRSGPLNTHTAFDPKPLIRAFEAARAHLISLSDSLTSRENELSAAVRKAEAHHGNTTAGLQRTLDGYVGQLRKLDATLNGGGNSEAQDGEGSNGNAALRIGERLEELERQRQRAQDAKRLVMCWLEVSERGSLGMLEEMKRSGWEGMVRSAGLARELLKIAARFDGQEAQTNGLPSSLVNGKVRNKSVVRNSENFGAARERIERFLEALETDLLQQFDVHYRRQNYDGMKVRSLFILLINY
jgi:hypothetical protein